MTEQDSPQMSDGGILPDPWPPRELEPDHPDYPEEQHYQSWMLKHEQVRDESHGRMFAAQMKAYGLSPDHFKNLAARARANDPESQPSLETVRRVDAMLSAIDHALIPAEQTLIGIGGWAEAGKDAAADLLVAHSGYTKTFMSEALSDAVTRLHKDGGPWVCLDHDVRVSGSLTAGAGEFIRYSELIQLVGYTAAKQHRDVRLYLQGLGTDVGREIDPEAWTKKAAEKIRALYPQPVVVTGIRYRNELELIRSMGGIAVWISRPGVEPVNDHSSEHALKPEDFDAIIENDGDVENDLARKMHTLSRIALEH